MTPVIFAIPSVMLLFLLFIKNDFDKDINSTKFTLFKFLYASGAYLIVTELLLYIIYKVLPLNNIGMLILFKLHWLSAFLLYFMLFLYIITFVNNDKYTFKELMNLKSSRAMLVYSIVHFLVFLLLPFDYYLPDGNLDYIPGLAAWCSLAYSAVVIISSTIYVIVYKGKTTQHMRRYIYTIDLFQIVVLLIQYFNRSLAFYPLGVGVIIYIIFIAYENPDLYVASNLQKLNNDVINAQKTKSAFISNMSEEIKSPATKIANLSQKLIREDLRNPEATRNDLVQIVDTGYKLLESVDNILDISKIESGEAERVHEEYSMEKVISDITDIILPKAQEKELEFGVEIGSNIPSSLEGDPTKIVQILNNVISNGIKYTKVGKVALMVNCDIEKDTAMVHFVISDSGIGIKEEQYDMVFKKPDDVSEDEKENEANGLGLYITKKYVELMNGKIWFESIPIVGTTFYIDIPQKILNYEVLSTDDALNKKNLSIDCTGKTALVVDDDILNATVTKEHLLKYGFEVRITTSGKETIKLIKRNEHVDIIFMDIMMPEMDGVETTKALKKLSKHFEIPKIIALTANVIAGMREKYISEGLDDYISKPIDSKELNTIIKKFVQPTRSTNYSISDIESTNSEEQDASVEEIVSDASRMVEYDIDDPFAFDDMMEAGATVVSNIDEDIPDDATITIEMSEK